MRFSEQWLREWVNPSLDTEGLVKRLTMAGLEVDAADPVAADFSGIVVGEVLSVEPHPDADKLRVCQVRAGAETLNVVCGAANVHPGMRAPLARVGAQLPGLTIKKSKLRGVPSEGMLCSASELGMQETSSGLLPLPGDAPVGEDVRAYLGLDDHAIEVDLTPNRSDCLSVMGIAREVGTLTRTPVKLLEIAPVPAQSERVLPLENSNPAACPHYAGRVVEGVNPRAATPLWMQERLRRSGLRSVSAVVDVTNYVLLELGQPMHAFDLAKLNGGIRVRNAQAGEKITLLDGQELDLDAETLVIADHAGAQALAGVMGGAASAVGDATTDIFLESAFFSPLQLAGCARRYGLHTDSSHRFERGVDPELQIRALERATALLLEITGGRPGPVVEFSSAAHLPALPTITLRASQISRLLGQSLEDAEIADCLSRLGMQVESSGSGEWRVVPPSFRFDVRLEVDLIEELARVHGYDRLPMHTPLARIGLHPLPPRNALRQIQAALVQRGYQEAVTYSFVDPALQRQLTPELTDIALSNPLSADLAVMRTTLWSSLLPVLAYNLKRQQAAVRLFETGLRFQRGSDGVVRQEAMLAGLVYGPLYPEQWGEARRNADFFDLKADLESLLKLCGQPYAFERADHPALHPGQSAAVVVGGVRVGIFGAIHPNLGYSIDLPSDVYLFELLLEPLRQRRVAQYQAVSRYPAMRRDLAVVVAQELAAAEVLICVHEHGGELLAQCQLFDVYQGKGVAEGHKSLALGLTFRSAARNLTEQEVDAVITQVLQALEHAFNAQLRE